jgi:hypothetical protein
MTLTSMDSTTQTFSGWRMSMYRTGIQVIITRDSGNLIIVNATLPSQQRPIAEQIHTFSFVYIADDGSGNSSLRAFWDGVSVGYTEEAYAPIDWQNSDNIYMGRFFDTTVPSTTYNNGLKIFKRALT